MAQPRTLSSFLALRRGATDADRAAQSDGRDTSRPKGPLLWAHCAEPDRLGALSDLVDRLRAEGDRLNMVLTLPPDLAGELPVIDGLSVLHAPVDHARAVRGFLDHWKPDVLLWLGGPLRSVLLGEARKMAMVRILAALDEDAPLLEGRLWLPGLARSALDSFDAALVTDAASGARLRRAGMSEGRITVAGPFEPGSAVLPYIERDHRELVALLGPRPAWHAANVPTAELPAVIRAHQIASRRSHRLLLILSTPDPDAAEPLIAAEGLSCANRIAGADPDAGTEVLLTDTAEPGLWYRLAALSYLGGTFTGAPCSDPFEAAALGSGLLHGIRTANHEAHFDRLTAAGGSRNISHPDDLGNAVETLLAPDKTAAMAHAAWEVTSAGAETSNQVVALIRSALDRAEER
ncbi:3-deoxy-D-manno-octulosonic acid transferase [Flavimaricola marinus]|uniref:3-deoxy-D-manno-octulosonic acid transferase n=1 Tax=Flavimaricola marinus TaxID=1819565 RepID=A0A238LH79_9RHOB|nr:glycosyltransferase N-terminal domain-containing protein [Flavimaricola marinus]SMY08316.1 3-deoxy-D-manno-octulosonic acid transferase [Flavimaricola marinus]